MFTRHMPRPARTFAAVDLFVGLLALAGAAVVGLAFVHRPQLNALDRFAFRALGPTSIPPPHLYRLLLELGSRGVLVGAVALAGALSVGHDWRRAIACVLGPLLAVFITESIAKPLVASGVQGFGGDSYPSGTVTAVAALATALTLATPARLRLITAGIGTLGVAAVAAAVIAVRWHFATDALGGTLVGCGAVLFFDGLVHLLGPNARGVSARDSD